MGTNTNSIGYCERAGEERSRESGTEEDGERKRGQKKNRAFKLSSRKIDIFAYIPRIRPPVDVIKRNKAHLYGTPREWSVICRTGNSEDRSQMKSRGGLDDKR